MAGEIKDVLGIGNAMVDVVSDVNDEFLKNAETGTGKDSNR